MAIPIPPSLMSLRPWHHHSRTMPKEFHQRFPCASHPAGDIPLHPGVWGTECIMGGCCLQHSHAATSLHCVSPPWAAGPICNLPPSPSHRPPPAVPPLWSAPFSPPCSGPSSTAGSLCCFVLPIRGFGRGSAEGSLPLTPCPSSNLSWWDSWDLSQERGSLWRTSRNFQHHATSACSQASWNPPAGHCSSSMQGKRGQGCHQRQVGRAQN